MIANTYLELANEIPIKKKTQVLVVGGGTAGWTAAVSAARQGAKVLLIDKETTLGGTMTLSMMHLFGGPSDYAHGLMSEVLLRLQERNMAILGPLTPFDGAAYASLIFEMLEESGVELLLDTVFSKPIVEDNVVKGIIVENKGGRSAIFADVIVDASGDGDVCASAGADFVFGRAEDAKTRPVTLLFQIGNIDVKTLLDWVQAHPAEFKTDPTSHIIDHEKGLYRLHGFFDLTEKANTAGLVDEDCHYMRFEYVWPVRGTAVINTTRIYNINALEPESLTEAVLLGYKQIDKLFRFIKSEVPGCREAYISAIAPRLGIRETRHIIGDHILTEAELIADEQFADTLYRDFRRLVPGVPVHSPDGKEGMTGDSMERDCDRPLFGFNIPYRCFLPKGLEGILMAGRCFSADHQADGWTRDAPGCVMMGQAAGTAAGLAAVNKTTPRAMDAAEIRKALQAQNVIVEKTDV